MLQSAAYVRYRTQADYALARLKHYREQGNEERVDHWHRAWSLAEDVAEAELWERSAGTRLLRRGSSLQLRPLPEEPAAEAPGPSPAAPSPPSESQPGAEDGLPPLPLTPPLAEALRRHARIDQALRDGGPNPLPVELEEDEWEAQLTAFRVDGPYECALLQDAEAAVEVLVEMLLEPVAARETAGPPPMPDFETVVLPECVRIYRESLAELTEDELRQDLVTCLDAGRADTAALIEAELREREREFPPEPPSRPWRV